MSGTAATPRFSFPFFFSFLCFSSPSGSLVYLDVPPPPAVIRDTSLEESAQEEEEEEEWEEDERGESGRWGGAADFPPPSSPGESGDKSRGQTNRSRSWASQ